MAESIAAGYVFLAKENRDYGLVIYNVLGRNTNIKLVGCNMHMRRYFEKAVTLGSKPNQSLGRKRLDFYQELYKIEECIKDLSKEDKYQKRQKLAAPLWDKMLQWSQTILSKVPPKSKIGKALYYFTAHYEELKFYLKDGSYQIDNGFIGKRSIKPLNRPEGFDINNID